LPIADCQLSIRRALSGESEQLTIGNWQSAMFIIINRQRQKKINRERWRSFGARALEAIDKSKHNATVVLVNDAAIKKLNRQFRGKTASTDVLSFPAAAEPFETEERDNLGEIVISVERAAQQAKRNQLSFDEEVKQLILHGLLHLSGYDHETDGGEMNRLELKLRKRLGI